MNPVYLKLENFFEPQILEADENILLVYKPPKMHSVPGNEDSLVQWCAVRFPEIMNINGHKTGEGGLIHRLDFETHGLLLFARNQTAFDFLANEQKQGNIIKHYDALAAETGNTLPGFPSVMPKLFQDNEPCCPCEIKSFFRAYAQGRKQVRPVICENPTNNTAENAAEYSIENEEPYCTKITECQITESFIENKNICYFNVSLRRGFRHQIRCHLAWAGFPIFNDALYKGKKINSGILALRAKGLQFTDPCSKKQVCYALPKLELNFLNSAAR